MSNHCTTLPPLVTSTSSSAFATVATSAVPHSGLPYDPVSNTSSYQYYPSPRLLPPQRQDSSSTLPLTTHPGPWSPVPANHHHYGSITSPTGYDGRMMTPTERSLQLEIEKLRTNREQIRLDQLRVINDIIDKVPREDVSRTIAAINHRCSPDLCVPGSNNNISASPYTPSGATSDDPAYIHTAPPQYPSAISSTTHAYLGSSLATSPAQPYPPLSLAPPSATFTSMSSSLPTPVSQADRGSSSLNIQFYKPATTTSSSLDSTTSRDHHPDLKRKASSALIHHPPHPTYRDTPHSSSSESDKNDNAATGADKTRKSNRRSMSARTDDSQRTSSRPQILRRQT